MCVCLVLYRFHHGENDNVLWKQKQAPPPSTLQDLCDEVARLGAPPCPLFPLPLEWLLLIRGARISPAG